MFSWFERRLNPYPDDQPTLPPKGLLAFCWHYTKPAWPWLLLLGSCSLIIAVAEVLLYQFLGNIVDWLASADRQTFLSDEGGKLIWMAVLVLVGLPLAGAVHTVTMHQVLAGNYPMIARWQMHRFLLRHSMAFFANEFAGRVSTKVMQTSLAVREATMKIIDVFVYAIGFFVSMLALVVAVEWRLVLPLILWFVFYVLILRYFIPRLRKLSSEQADARSMMTGRIVDSYTNIGTVKLFSHAGREESYAKEGMNEFLGTVHRQMRQISLLNIFVDLNNALTVFAVAGLGIWLWMGGGVSVGSIAVAIGLAMRINGMSQWIMWEVTALFEAIGTVYDGMNMMTKPHDVTDANGARPLATKKGHILYENVRFHYGKSKGVIDGLTLDIAAGQKVGLVGRSGAGKTTLMNLLLRFYDLEGGRITIDGQDISSVTQDSLRGMIGVVTQDTSLLHRSIRDNIAYGRPDATDAEIIQAAKRANAFEFIEGLSDLQGRTGLDAHVGERGVKLSGGQRQRIAIARVFLKDAPILVLDEATSALDSEVEAAIQENLFALMEGKTVIAIAHRLSTLTEMDRLIVLDKGRIVETGTHEQLASGGGIYADLWHRQSGGFLGDQSTEEEAAE
ncbi:MULTISPECIES: ABC transporter ATP-binding protein [Rhizobiaceae]|jgi:ATP-binding cassette subfamily B multidrug efflux pump|uniref:ATP-binding cassette subfamily B multidrug efflux pump n=1 Tax=Aliirhizobium cellulosilyticum TaxID=393664 RepID=A0A7W6S5W4_9HYPH|nr:ABC transporter ATP-binding protein [Rhizobium cellulosilyticum]MBB4347188.1 ATP-binding cassette subfamily B multidrug efflux pump [Rhizobium cellulosilyticum]MBB4410418.1 ATP-binding cassette subfamily B multidrug efflux pump [Rhizobium cellulosilyticum]MBB4445105.1 ATP-binding cassette subfamily B multidrug efflux pump [Rhizobium cellulosilyticum]